MTEEPIWWQYFKAVAGTEDGQTIAAAASVTPPQVSRWKTGKNRPSADQVIKFARHYERSPVEALMSTGYLTSNDVGGMIEISVPAAQDLDDAELLGEVERRLSARRALYERTLVQIMVAVGQLQTYADAMADGDEEEDVSEIVNHLGVLMYSLHQLTSTVLADPSRMSRMTAETAMELRSRQVGHVIPEGERNDPIRQISAWPFDYSKVKQMQSGIEIRSRRPAVRVRAGRRRRTRARHRRLPVGCRFACRPQACRTISTTASTTAAASANVADRTVCAAPDGLQSKGDGYYQTFRHLMLTGQPMSIDPLTLTGQLRTLATVGAPAGETDGSAAINDASPPVRLALNNVVRDASTLAQLYAAAANGQPTEGGEMTTLVNSFTSALIACTDAGYKPSYFDPNELTGH